MGNREAIEPRYYILNGADGVTLPACNIGNIVKARYYWNHRGLGAWRVYHSY